MLVLALLEILCIQILEKMYWIVFISLVGGITLNNVLNCCNYFPEPCGIIPFENINSALF